MDKYLAAALINKGVLPAGTEVEAHYSAVGLGGVNNVSVTGYFSIVSAKILDSGSVLFQLASLRDGAISKVLAENVINVDGMDPARFASVYGIKADGGVAVQKARRGRKPKDRSPEGLAKAAALAALVADAALATPANDDSVEDVTQVA